VIVVKEIGEAWQDDLALLDLEGPELYVSEMNVAHLTRDGVLADFLQEPEALASGLQTSDVDLAGRTNDAFEQYWQDALAQHSYGEEHPGVLLELFASYTEAGMAAGGFYGVDVMHAGRLSWYGEDGQSHTFVGGEMLQMLYESVEGAHLVQSGVEYSPENPVTPYIFEDDDKLVVFLSAGAAGAGNYTLNIDGLGSTFDEVWAERLGAEVLPDWMTTFGIVDNPLVDETPEAGTYAAPVRETINTQFTEDGLMLNISAPNEIVRLAFAKTDAGATDISSWSQAPGMVPRDLIIDSNWAYLDDTAAQLAEEEDFVQGDDGGIGFGALFLLLLAFI